MHAYMQGLSSTPAAGTEAPAAEASTVYSVTPSGEFSIDTKTKNVFHGGYCSSNCCIGLTAPVTTGDQ
jgi:hypothetical protein